MGLFDSMKKKLGATVGPQTPSAPPPEQAAPESEPETTFDLAGFDPLNDEEAFFDAVLQMESEGEMGGTAQSRAETMARYGIENRPHWHLVKASAYSVLVRKYGAIEAVSQREMNFQSGLMQKKMASNVAAKAASGETNPVEGVSLEAWAAINAAIIQGSNLGDLLKGAGIDPARWDRVRAEWEARMSRDTTFAIATIYGNAFQAASQGKYSNLAREANAARAANADLSSEPPISLEQYYDILYEQAYAAAQGKSAAEALKSMGLSIVDFCDLSSFMGYHFHRTGVLKFKEYEAVMKRVQQKFEAKYPGLEADVDISF